MSGTTWLFVSISLVFIGLSLPLVLRRVPPNLGYGLRVPATFKDERVWYDANASTGRELFVLGVALLVFALLPPLFGWRGETHWLAWSALLIVGSLTMLVVGWRRANRMLRQRRAESSPSGAGLH